jgi:hypothetical protein
MTPCSVKDILYIYIYLFNCNWVDTRWQQYSSHLHTNSTQVDTQWQQYSSHLHTNSTHSTQYLLTFLRDVLHLCWTHKTGYHAHATRPKITVTLHGVTYQKTNFRASAVYIKQKLCRSRCYQTRPFMERKCSFWSSKEPTTGLFPEPVESMWCWRRLGKFSWEQSRDKWRIIT